MMLQFSKVYNKTRVINRRDWERWINISIRQIRNVYSTSSRIAVTAGATSCEVTARTGRHTLSLWHFTLARSRDCRDGTSRRQRAKVQKAKWKSRTITSKWSSRCRIYRKLFLFCPFLLSFAFL